MHDADNRFSVIARIGKAHGLDGTVRIRPEISDAESFLKKNQILYLQNRRGDLIPARIEKLRSEKKRNSLLFFVKFDQIADRTEAESFLESPVYIDRVVMKEPAATDMETQPDVIGYTAVDDSGIEAIVKDVLKNPAHPILELEYMSQRFLVPWVDAYVLAIDHDKKVLQCQDLDQLKEI